MDKASVEMKRIIRSRDKEEKEEKKGEKKGKKKGKRWRETSTHDASLRRERPKTMNSVGLSFCFSPWNFQSRYFQERRVSRKCFQNIRCSFIFEIHLQLIRYSNRKRIYSLSFASKIFIYLFIGFE